MRVVRVPSENRIIISLEDQWFTKYVVNELSFIYDSYIADVTEEFGAVKALRNDVLLINIEVRSSIQTHHCYIIKYQGRKCRISKDKSGDDKAY